MGEVFFYHLTRQSVEQALPQLLKRARGAGWRVAVRGVTKDRLNWLDEKLWLDEGFLPHAVAGSGFDADQPILLTLTTPENEAECLVSFDGAEVSPAEVTGMTRTMIVFNGHDGEAVQTARGQWKALTEARATAQYWSQESGAWEMKAQHPPQEA